MAKECCTGCSPFALLYPLSTLLWTQDSISGAPLPSGFWLGKANGRHQQRTGGWEKSEVWVLFPGFLLTELQFIRGCVSFHGYGYCRPFAIDAILPILQSFRSQRQAAEPSSPASSGGLISCVDFPCLCPMSINCSDIPLCLVTISECSSCSCQCLTVTGKRETKKRDQVCSKQQPALSLFCCFRAV